MGMFADGEFKMIRGKHPSAWQVDWVFEHPIFRGDS